MLLISKVEFAPRLASFLLWCDSEHPVFQASVLSIALILAVGPNASLLCRTWCDRPVSGACHQQPSTTLSVSGGDDCNTVVPSVAILYDSGRRGEPSPGGDQPSPVFHTELMRSAAEGRPGYQPRRAWALHQRPLPTILRI